MPDASGPRFAELLRELQLEHDRAVAERDALRDAFRRGSAAPCGAGSGDAVECDDVQPAVTSDGPQGPRIGRQNTASSFGLYGRSETLAAERTSGRENAASSFGLYGRSETLAAERTSGRENTASSFGFYGRSETLAAERTSGRENTANSFGFYSRCETLAAEPTSGLPHSDSRSGRVLTVGWPRSLKTRMAEHWPEQRMPAPDIADVAAALGEAGNASERAVPQGSAVHVLERAVLSGLMIAHPSSKRRACFDCVGLIVLFVDVTVVPYTLAWNSPVIGVLAWMSWFTMAFWTLDLLASFRTGFYQGGELIMDVRSIRNHYLKTWFLFDLAVVLSDWLNLVIELANDRGDSISGFKFMRLAKAGRFLKIFAVLRVIRRIRTFEDLVQRGVPDSFMSMLTLMRLFIGILWLNHIIACAWYAVGTMPSGKEDTWTSSMEPSASLRYQYATALHWAFSQISPGSMEIFPCNFRERAYNIVILCCGLLFVSSLVSSMSATLVRLQMQSRSRNEYTRTLRRFLEQHSIPPTLAVCIQKQAQQQLSSRPWLAMRDVAALAHLSPTLRAELHTALFEESLQSHQLFSIVFILHPPTVRKLCLEATHTVWLASKEELFVAGADASCAYRLVSGRISYTQDPSSSFVKEREAVAVEDGDWLCRVALWCHWSHVGTAESLATCQLVALGAERMIDIVGKHQVLRELVQAYGSIFHERLVSAGPPRSEWPNDLCVPFTDADGIVASMPRGLRSLIGLAALKHAMSSNSWRVPPDFERLKKEVDAGRSVVLLSEACALQRVVLLVLVRIKNNDRKLLARVGRVDGSGQVVGVCELPGSKPLEDESLEATTDRIMRTELYPFASHVEFESVRHEIVEQKSRRFGISTKYHKVVQDCDLVGAHPVLQKTNTVRPSQWTSAQVLGTSSLKSGLKASMNNYLRRSHTGALAAGSASSFQDQAFVMHSEKSVGTATNVYAWVSPAEFAYLSSAAGEQELQDGVSHLDSTSLPVLLTSAASGGAADEEPQEMVFLYV